MPVIDTCILSSLSKINKLYVLTETPKDYRITPSVLNELDKNRIAGFKFVEKIYELLADGKLQQTPVDIDGLKNIQKLREKYRLSLADCECIIACREHNDILLTDDTYLAKIAAKEGIKQVYDLKDLLGASITNQTIENNAELHEIISLLKEKDHYEFSEPDKRYLLSLLEKKPKKR